MILCGKEAEAIGKLEKARGVRMIENGRVAERFNVPDSKSGVGVTLPWVQIPPRPSLRGRGKLIKPEAKCDWARGGCAGAKSHPFKSLFPSLRGRGKSNQAGGEM